MHRWSIGLSILLAGTALFAQGQDGGKAQVEGAAGSLILENHLIAALCSSGGDSGLHVEIKDVREGRTLMLDGPLSLLFRDGATIRTEQMRIVDRPAAEDLK